MGMIRKYVLLSLFCGCLPAAALRAQQPDTAAARPAAVSAEASVLPAADQDPALVEKLRALRAQLHAEYAKKRASTPEEALSFRQRAVALTIEYHNLLRRKPAIPLLDDGRFEAQRLIYEYPRVAAHIFAEELEIYKSTEAYDYKAQAESVYGHRDEAEEDWTAAIKMAPEPELLRHRGDIYLRLHEYEKAIADFTAAIKGGAAAPVYYSRAIADMRQDDYAGAAEDLGQFFKLNTDKDYSVSVAHSRLCSGLRRRGFEVPGCAPATGGDKK